MDWVYIASCEYVVYCDYCYIILGSPNMLKGAKVQRSLMLQTQGCKSTNAPTSKVQKFKGHRGLEGTNLKVMELQGGARVVKHNYMRGHCNRSKYRG